MRGSITGAVAAFLALIAGTPTLAADLHVPQNHATIEIALTAARAGDRVVVAPGTYREWGLELGDGVSLVGDSWRPSDVVIDGGGNGRILVSENHSQTTRVANLTFTGGRAEGPTTFGGSGGALRCSYSDVVVESCVFIDNEAARNGGAVWVFEATPQFIDCRFENNRAAGGGGAIELIVDASATIRDSWFENNTADWGAAISCRDYSAPTIVSSMFSGNAATGTRGFGGGVFSDTAARPSLTLCTVADNLANFGGGVANLAGAPATLVHCTLAGNQANRDGGGVYAIDAAAVVDASIIAFQNGAGVYSGGEIGPQMSRSDLYANTGGGWIGQTAQMAVGDDMLALDPKFCNPDLGDPVGFNLMDTSPCRADLNGGVTLGSRPVGCAEPPPELHGFEAEWGAETAQLTWQVDVEPDDTLVFRLTGASRSAPATEWEIAFTEQGDGVFTADDPLENLQGDGPYVFRLYYSHDGIEWTLLDETDLVPPVIRSGLSDLQAAPNPFNPQTIVSFRLAVAERVRIAIYDVSGRRVRILADEPLPAGLNERAWDGRSQSGGLVASGTYVVVVEGQEQKLALKVLMLK